MDVVSLGPLPASSLVWQPRAGAWVLTVVARATFILRPGEATLAPSQEPPAPEDRHTADDPTRSLRAPRDLVPVKPLAEVLLVGHAFAPDRRPARSVVARLVVGDVDKSIEVVSDRLVSPEGAIHEGAPFTQMPLVYERAAGGPQTSNPVCVPRGARDGEGRIVLPNLQRPGSTPASIDPIGFGPISPSWPERRDRLGKAVGWSYHDLATRPLPEGMDLGYFNAGPRDQQTRLLGPSEPIVLEHLHPDCPRLVTRLPGIAARATLEGRRSGPIAIAMRADTLWIDTDRRVCTVTFRGMIPIEGPNEQGRVTVTMDGAQTQGTSGVTRAPEPEERPRARRYDTTADIPLAVRQASGAVLPFASSPTRAPEPAPVPVELPSIASPWALAPTAAPSGIAAQHVSMIPSVLDASNAAAGVANVAPQVTEAQASRPAAEPRAPARALPTEILDLVWFDVESVPRVRRKPAFRALLDAAEKSPLDHDFDDPAMAKDPMLVEDRREVFEILARGEPLTLTTFDEAIAGCQREDGKFVPTIALFAGDIEMPFDELAALRATMGTVTPLMGTDDTLRAAVDTAKEMLALPDLTVAPAVVEALTRRIDHAFSQGKRAVPTDYVETQRERALVEHRRYKRQTVFGDKHLRALYRFDAAPTKASQSPPLPVYMPDGTASLLPLSSRFRARFVAEIRLSAEVSEQSPIALKVLAIARAAPALRRG